MQWEKYRATYQVYEFSMALTSLATMVGADIYRDFPARLPLDLAKRFEEASREVLSQLEAFGPVPGGDESARFVHLGKSGENMFIHRVLDMMTAMVMLGYTDPKEIDLGLQSAVCSQALVMYFAHLDAFLADTLRMLCQVNPQILSTGKKIAWETIMALGGWDELIDHLTEQYAFEFGWGTVRQRVESFEGRLGLAIGLSESELQSLSEAENLRHIVIHNGGRVSEEFVARTGRTDLAPGTIVRVTLEYVEGVLDLSRLLANRVFRAVSAKFFGKDDSTMVGVWEEP